MFRASNTPFHLADSDRRGFTPVFASMVDTLGFRARELGPQEHDIDVPFNQCSALRTHRSIWRTPIGGASHLSSRPWLTRLGSAHASLDPRNTTSMFRSTNVPRFEHTVPSGGLRSEGLHTCLRVHG